LEGSVEGAKDSENILLYYFTLQNEEWQEIADTAKIINGKFLMKGYIDGLTAAELCFDDQNVVISARIYLEPTTMKLHINKNQPYTYQLSGTKVEKENKELRKELASYEPVYYEKLEDISNLIEQIKTRNDDTLIRDNLFSLMDQEKDSLRIIVLSMNKIRLDFISEHPTYQIVSDLLYLLARQEYIPIDSLKSIYNNLPEQSKASLLGKLANKQIEYQESKDKRKRNSLVGCMAPDFTRKSFSGKTIQLSEFKNKNVILLDFWASWCSPCLKEIPTVKNLYDKYKGRGLRIIGVSLDTDSSRWINAIGKHKLDRWPQILNNQNEAIANEDVLFNLYNIENGIPYFILIDKQGKIAARWEYLDKEQLIELDSIVSKK